jgi:diaminopimelate decarboxylase
MIVDNCLIPKPKLNDVLIWTDMGAYSLSSSVNGFNGFKMADIHLEE